MDATPAGLQILALNPKVLQIPGLPTPEVEIQILATRELVHLAKVTTEVIMVGTVITVVARVMVKDPTVGHIAMEMARATVARWEAAGRMVGAMVTAKVVTEKVASTEQPC